MSKAQKSEFLYLPYFNNRPQFRLITHELILAHDLRVKTSNKHLLVQNQSTTKEGSCQGRPAQMPLKLCNTIIVQRAVFPQ
jgi:hypothetical protein